MVLKGDKVKIEYTGTFDDGSIFDSSKNHGKPFEFVIGSSQVIPGFEKAITGMEKGEEKDIHLKPSEAYGEPNPKLIQKVPKDKLPKDPEPKEGMVLALKMPDGTQVPATIIKVEKETVTIDLNHPLVGKSLNFKIKLLEIVS